MKAIVFAADSYGEAVLERLKNADVCVPLVFSTNDEFSQRAEALGFTVNNGSDPSRSTAAYDAIVGAAPDVLVVVCGYGHKVSTHVAKLAKHAVYLHPSLLPKLRGPNPSNWAIIEGLSKTGVSLVQLARQNDAGDLLMQRPVQIGPLETDGELRERLAVALGDILVEYLRAIESGVTYAGKPQGDLSATMYPSLTRRDGHIRFDQGTTKILDRIRGVTPQPGAYTDFCGVEFSIEAASAEGGEAYDDEPGHVLAVDHERHELLVKSMDGMVRLRIADPLNRLGAIVKRNADLLLFAGKITPFSAKTSSGEAAYDKDMPDADEFTRYLNFPDMVVIAVAYPCNAHCPNCPYTPENSEIRAKYGDAQFMSSELFMKIADECGEAARRKWLPGGVGSMIRITGGGEPMMHPYGMTKLIEYAKNVGARVYLNSNGSLFKQEDIDRLLACNVDNIEISVDAGDRDTYAVVRKGLDWDHLLETLRYMIQQRNLTRSLTTIEVSVINQDIVSGKVPEIEKFWYDLGVDNVIVRKFLTWGSSTNIDPNSSADPLAYLDRDSGVPCPYPFHRLNVDSRGKVEVCGFDIMGRTNMGNIKDQTIREIWQGTMFSWWRRKHQAGEGGDIPLCAECPDWKYRSWEHNYRKALKNAQIRRDAAFEAS